MNCQECDKPLNEDEARECFSCCFECERERAVGRLIHHVAKGRITLTGVLDLLYAEARQSERTSG